MRKVFAFSFLAILLLNTFGYFISFSIERLKIRADIERTLKLAKQQHTQLFTFTPKQYESLPRFENDQEFSLNGNRYDVLETYKKEGNIIIAAFFDEKETDLLETFIALFSKQSTPSNQKQVIPAFTLLEFVNTTISWHCYVPLRQLGFFAPRNSKLLSVSLNISSPPPDSNFL